MPAAIPIAGAVIGALGSKKQADAQKKASAQAAQAAQFTPYDIGGLGFGGVDFGNGTVKVNSSADSDALRSLLGGTATNMLSGGGLGDFSSFISQLGNQGLPSIFGNALGQSEMLPFGAFGQQQGTLGMLGDQAQGLLGGFMQQANPLYSGLQNQLAGRGMQLLNQAARPTANGFGNTFGLLGQASGLLGGGLNTSQAQNFLSQAASMGQGLDLSGANNLINQAAGQFGNVPGVQGMVNDRLNLLRQQAAPFEERAFDSLQQRLFSQGRLGSTGGSLDTEAFARGLGQADLSRQLEAQNLGMAAQDQLFGQAASRAGLFGNLAGQSLNAASLGANNNMNLASLFSGLAGQSLGIEQALAGNRFNQANILGGLAGTSLGAESAFNNLGQSQAALLGQLGQGALSQAQGFGGLDLNRALGFSGQLPGLLGLSGDFANQGLAGAMDFSNLTNARAQQRLSNAMSLFGFGQDVNASQLNQGLQALGGQQSIDQQLMQLIALGGNLGGQQAYSGANQANAILRGGVSAGGSLLGGIGAGLLSSADNLTSLIKKEPTNA